MICTYTITNNRWPIKSELWLWRMYSCTFAFRVLSFQTTNFLDYRHWVSLPEWGCKTGISACQQQPWPANTVESCVVNPQAGLPLLILAATVSSVESVRFMGSTLLKNTKATLTLQAKLTQIRSRVFFHNSVNSTNHIESDCFISDFGHFSPKSVRFSFFLQCDLGLNCHIRIHETFTLH